MLGTVDGTKEGNNANKKEVLRRNATYFRPIRRTARNGTNVTNLGCIGDQTQNPKAHCTSSLKPICTRPARLPDIACSCLRWQQGTATPRSQPNLPMVLHRYLCRITFHQSRPKLGDKLARRWLLAAEQPIYSFVAKIKKVIPPAADQRHN